MRLNGYAPVFPFSLNQRHSLRHVSHLRFLALAILFLVPVFGVRADIVVSEIMYHPSSENPEEEYVELLNTGGFAEDVGGWRASGGIALEIPPGTTIPAGGRLVLVADAAAFSIKYPTVTGVVGNWSGQLSNAADSITLRDASDAVVCEVTYADDGDWGERRREAVADHGHRGWEWFSEADGHGKSLELINPGFVIDEAQNWAPSIVMQGTPGAPNSVASADIACIIDKVAHFPLVPKSTDTVTVSCRVRDDLGNISGVVLHHRIDGVASFSTAPMFDDGAHGDGLSGDGVFGAFLPAVANGARVEFFIGASDGAHERFWPAPARSLAGDLGQTQNCIYQVDNAAYAGSMPLYRIIMRAVDAQELAAINANTGVPPFAYNPGEEADQTLSHSRFNATFISFDGTGQKVRYMTGIRNRGNGSRTATPPNYNVHFSNAADWNDRTALVLNSQNTPYQLLASTLFRKAGLAGAESRAVRLRVNSTDPTGGATVAPTYGFYACNEFPDDDFTSRHFPQNSGGSIYRGQRYVTGLTAGGTDLDGASLRQIVPGPQETLTLPELYALNFRKETNKTENNWSDLIALAAALAKGTSGATVTQPTGYTTDYETAVEETVDVRQWMRWLAVNTMADNEETNISNGDGDDYYLYFGKTDPRAVLLHHDLDTVLGRSPVSNSATHGIFRMCDAPDGSPTPLNPFMKYPKFAPIYFEELQRLLDGVFAPSNFEDTCDQMLAPVTDVSLRTAIKNFNSARHAYVSGLIPRALSISAVQATNGTTLSPVNGYPQTANSECRLSGFAPAIETRSVQVNGTNAEWSAWEARWALSSLPLTPGVNRVLIQAFDGNGAEIARTWQDVWRMDGDEEIRSGTLSGNETWTAADGPYRLASNVTVPSGVTLKIEPGVTVFANSGAALIVAAGGNIHADGTYTEPVRFMPVPGVASWGGIEINGTAGSPATRISHAYILGNSGVAIDVHGAEILLNDVTFGNAAKSYLDLDDASFVVADCVFPAATTAFEMVVISGIRPGGKGVFRGCYFGKTIGQNDTIDAEGIQRPGPILSIVNNVFTGSDDDILDLDEVDAWVEGNIFMNAIRNGTSDTSSAVSGGHGNSEITIIGNIFYCCDYAATATDGNFFTMLNNTVLAPSPFSQNASVINFLDPGSTAGAGMYLEGNIIQSPVAIARNAGTSTIITLNNNLLSSAWVGAGTGNIVASPLLEGPLVLSPPEASNYRSAAAEIRARLSPGPQSPARGSGRDGMNKGAGSRLGVMLSGAPSGLTNSGSASIRAGLLMQGFGISTDEDAFPQGSGWTHYRWRLNGGPWSAVTPIAQPIALASLPDGEQFVEVSGKADSGLWQDGPELDEPLSTVGWTVDSGYIAPPGELVRINEIMALNTETSLYGGIAPDEIELHNSGSTSVSLAGWGLTDNPDEPFKYTFPPGTMIAAGGYLVVHATNVATVPAPRTGFALKREGDSLTLTRNDGAGAVMVDTVSFGRQLADYSIGRAADGSWALCKPTFGTANVLSERAALSSVVINEWLAESSVLASEDFVELHNRSTYPADIGGCHLTDNPADWPERHEIRRLTFIEPGGYVAFQADGEEDDGPEHLNFKLDALQGEIGFLSRDLEFIDNVVYGSQSADISEGLTPNGAGSVARFNQPTPGGPNPAIAGTTSTMVANLVPENQAWRFFANGSGGPAPDSGNRSFTAPAYDDSAWSPASQQLFYIETAALTNADGFVKATPVAGISSSRPFQTYYFRTHFNYSGPLSGVTLTAKVMCDDGANIYLNGGGPTPVRMNAGATGYLDRANASVGDATVQTFTIPAADLVVGDNVIAVSVHQFNLQSSASPSSDIVWGMKLDAAVTTTFPVVPVVLNEVLAVNTTLQNPDGSYSGWAEIANPTALPIDISDMSLSDDLSQPRKFVFPTGTIVVAGGRHVVQFNPLANAGAANTGWALSGDGGTLGFYHTPANAGALHDSIAFGRQIPNYTIGRVPDINGAWTLTVPTRGGMNAGAALGQANNVKLNEWRTDSGGFFELRNGGTVAVDLGGNFFTDNVSSRMKFPIPPLTFIGAEGNSRWQVWQADGLALRGHVNFSLQSTDSLAFYTASGTALDLVPSIGTQPAGLSAGRFPEGSNTVANLVPTPGAANQIPVSDSDGDGMPDAWESAHGLNPNAAGDAASDDDGDGQSNLAEYLAGTNPHFAGDAFRATMDTSAAGGPVIRFVAVAGKTYTVQYKTSLSSSNWQRLGDVSSQASTGVVSVPDPAGASAGQRFYRIVTPAVP